MKKLLILISTILIALLLITGCGLSGEFTDINLDVPTITVNSTSIVEGKLLTASAAGKKSNDPIGKNKSPAVNWESVKDANYYAVIMFDESTNWLHFFVTDITTTEIEEGKYTNTKNYIGAYPPKSSGVHTYRIEVFAIKKEPNAPIGQIDSRESYSGIVNHLNQVGDNSDNILARGYIKGTYQNGDNTEEATE
jgi:hypothetical protein